MTWETFPCCCAPQPCVCAGVYTSLTVKWTGSVRFIPLECREYWRRWVNGESTCGFNARLVLQQPQSFGIGTIVVPGLNAFTCLSYGCITRDVVFDRYFQSFEPYPGSPEYYDPAFRCQYDQLDNIFGPYLTRMRHSVAVFGPQNGQFGSIGYWRVWITIGSVNVRFRSVEDNFSCSPQQFILDPDYPLPDRRYCHGPCGVSVQQCGTACEILNPPIPPFTYPGGGGSAGSTLAHDYELDVGSLQVG